jgi:hypothetical protein
LAGRAARDRCVKQVFLHEPVEMKRRGGARQNPRGGGLVAGDWFRLVYHVAVEPVAGRLIECGDR